MARLSSGVISLCGLLWLLTGCGATIGPWHDRPPPTARLTEPAPIWAHLASRRRRFQNLKGLAQVTVSATVRRVALDDVVVVLRGFDAVRLEGIGPLGQPVFLMIADAKRFALYSPQEAQLLSGAASAENLSRLFGVELEPAVLPYLLVGDVPLPTLPDGGTLTYRRRQNLYVWKGQLPGDARSYRIWFEPYAWHPVRVEARQPSGEVALLVQYDDFRAVADFLLPYRIALSQPLVQRRLVWQYQEVQLNAEVSAALFQMRVPPGIRRVELE